MTRKPKIAIDGPAGAGKSTIARHAAKRLRYLYVDTGALYRAVTLMVILHKIDIADEQPVIDLVKNTEIKIVPSVESSYLIYANGADVTSDIRHPQVSGKVSQVARIPGVRDNLLQLQRDLASDGVNNFGGVVMEGRDIGTKVLPEADFKFFLTANAEERARRRYVELINKGYEVDYDSILDEIKKRDNMDSVRPISPLKPASDAIFIDCSNMSVDKVIDFIVSQVTRR